MRCYIAGKYTAQDRLRIERDRLRALGHYVSSNWMDQPEKTYAVTPERAISEAYRDIEEIRDADTLIIDTLDESNTGGREVELGCALAWGHKIVRIGPERNIFHSLAPATFPDWESFLACLPQPQAQQV